MGSSIILLSPGAYEAGGVGEHVRDGSRTFPRAGAFTLWVHVVRACKRTASTSALQE